MYKRFISGTSFVKQAFTGVRKVEINPLGPAGSAEKPEI